MSDNNHFDAPFSLPFSSFFLPLSLSQVTEVPDFNLIAVELLHDATKAQHIHLARQDSNNVFG